MPSSISGTRYKLFDNFGRLTEMEQRTPFGTETAANATPQVSQYVYDFGGRMIKEIYPSGREVSNEFETDGDLSQVFGQVNANATDKTYVNSFSYTASGGISQMRLGNGKWETAKFNDRLQVTELGLGNSSADASAWKVNYAYGELDSNGDVIASTNTGNIGKMTLSFAGLANPLVQRFKYDSLYRLTEATERSGTAITSPQNWVQNYGYDRFGNRLSFSQNIGGISKNTTPTIDDATNRFVTGQGFVYDKNGNITNDVSDSSQNRQFVFNAENKQTEVKDANGNPIGKYFYDGENRRVKKITDAETTVFVYSSGKLVAEYSTKLADNPSTNYITTDHLGTPRVITNELGQVKSRRDFMPFGEELTINVGERSQGLKYGTADDIRQKFTGYQKDEETKLDFAEARMYENRHARFTAVDPLLASGKSANPQSFNRYVYTGNNPILRVDRNGLDWLILITKQKEKQGNRTVEVDVATPLWVAKEDGDKGERAPNIWSVNFGENQGFQALHPTDNIASEIFKTREDAQAQYDKWTPYGTKANPATFAVVFESTLFSGAPGSELKGIPGHVANGINSEVYSWDNTGYAGAREKHPSFSDYIQYNSTYRSGTVYQFDFGSAERNRAAADAIKLGPRNGTSASTPFFGSRYNLITNNCGETMCRVAERLNLPENNATSPRQHNAYIKSQLQPYIVATRRIGPVPKATPNDVRSLRPSFSLHPNF